MKEATVTLGELVRETRTAMGLSQAALGEKVGLSQQAIAAIERGDVAEPRNLKALVDVLGLSLEIHGLSPNKMSPREVRTPFRVKGQHRSPSGVTTVVPMIPAGPPLAKELPVLGVAAGGNAGAFHISDTTYDTVPAPPELANVAGSYVVYCYGESMVPRFYAGERVYVHPRLPVARGDFVVVQLAESGETEPTEGIVKQFVSQDDESLILHQFNPEQDLAIPIERVRHMHKIVFSGRPY
nr:XRE family transcriptional regulator [Chelatococcus sp. HY11]